MMSYLPAERILFSMDAFGQHIANPQQFDDESSTDTGEAVVSVRVWSEQGSVDERQMRIGDVIVFEDYRLRLLKIGSSGVDIALTTLGDLPTPSEE